MQMAGGDGRQFGVSSRGRQASGVSRREAIVGGVAIFAVLAIFAVFAVISVTAESEKPELVAGTFFVPFYDLDSTSGPVGFAVVDGGPAGRLSQVPEIVGQERNNQQWIRVFNSPSGSYLVDRSNGNTSLVLPSIATASATPTAIAPPQAGSQATEGASIFGATSDQGLFLVRRARTPGGGYYGYVHLLTPTSVSAGVEVGATELTGTLPASTLVADAAAAAGDQRFAGLGDAGRYADSLAIATTADAVWVVVEADGGGRLLRISAPTAEAVTAFQEAAAAADPGESVAPPQLRVDDVGEVSTSAVLVPQPSRRGIAAADPVSGTVAFFGDGGQTGRVTVDGLAGADQVLPADGGSLAWFLVGSASDGWRAVGVGTSGQVRSVEVPGADGVDVAPPVVAGSTMFTASLRDGTVLAVDLDSGEAVAVADGGRYPLEPELDGPAGPGGGLTAFDYQAVTLELHGPRVSVNIPGASLALLLEADGSLVEVLVKGQADPIDPDASIDPNTRGDAEEPPDPEQETEETVGTQAANEEREGDSSIICEPDDSTEPRSPLLLPQSGDRAATAITPRWRYELVSATDCLPSFRVELRELPNGDAEERDLARPNELDATVTGLKPSTDYEVTVIAFIGQNTARSNTARYSTGPAAPETPTNVRFGPATDSWVLEWDACTTAGACDTPAVEFEVEWSDGSQAGSGSAVVSASGALRQVVPVDDTNVGRNLCFTVVAVGANASASEPAPSEAGLCGVRERAPRGTGSSFTVTTRPDGRNQSIVFSSVGLTRENFPLIMGTRRQVFVDVTFTGLPAGYYEGTQTFAWAFDNIPAGGTLGEEVPFPGIPAGLPGFEYSVTFRNEAGAESNSGNGTFEPISCGALPINITGFDRFDPGSQSWAIRFTVASNPCPGAPPLPALIVNAPPGCAPYPGNLTITCTTANLVVDPVAGTAFGYSVQAVPPEGFLFDGISFANGPYVLARPGPFDRFNGRVWFQEARQDPAPANTYVVTIRNENLVTPSSLGGCTFLGSSGATPNQLFRYRCAAPEDPQMMVPRTFRITPGQALPQGPYPANQGTCSDSLPASFVQVPSAIATLQGTCLIGLKKIYNPEVSTTLPSGDNCPYGPDDPEFLTDPRCVVEPPEEESTTTTAALLPLGLLGASGLVFHALSDRRRPGSRRRGRA